MAKKKRKRNVEPENKLNKNLLYAAIAVVAVIVIALIWSFSGSSTEVPEEKITTSGKFLKINEPSTYEPGKVKIIDYFKFNCGHCYSLNQRMPELEEKYGDQLEITYRPMLWLTEPKDLPFRKSNEAYIIAERMGKGDEMKSALFDALFLDNKDLSDVAVLEDIASSIGLGDDFATALENGEARDEAQEYINLARPLVLETPTIIINGNLKVTPTLTGGGIDQMVDNMDTIIGSLLS
ncbi:MAG TPA: DsbA family protein [Candidatus Nanoarchaeia archaeon]|nr:DsbA family protein [Candidatus Nanoarchaeia archaeon]